MSEPAKKIDQTPESYSPKAKPEILKMAAASAAQPTAPPQAAVLHGVPKEPSGAFGDTHFPKYLKVVSDYLGDALDYTYAIVACGGAFRLAWNTADDWDPGSGAIQHTYTDEETLFRNGITALGRECRMLWRGTSTKEEVKAFIKEQIGQGRPVISLGPVGPPEAGVITGYRAGGDTLLGWSSFQGWAEFWPGQLFDEEGYFVCDTWWEGSESDITAVMSLGELAAPRAGVKEIIANAIVALEGRQEGDYAKGIAAYDAWKRSLLGVTKRDIKGPEGNMFGDYFLCVCNGEPINCLSDGRKYAQEYFEALARGNPEQPLYTEIAAQFGRVTEILRGKMARAMRGKEPCGPRQKKALARARTRRKLGGYIDEMKAADEKALALMKELLEEEA